jgi:hypothetical protein
MSILSSLSEWIWWPWSNSVSHWCFAVLIVLWFFFFGWSITYFVTTHHHILTAWSRTFLGLQPFSATTSKRRKDTKYGKSPWIRKPNIQLQMQVKAIVTWIFNKVAQGWFSSLEKGCRSTQMVTHLECNPSLYSIAHECSSPGTP